MKIFTLDELAPILQLVEDTRGVEQMAIHHPEGDVLTHSLQVVQLAFRESIDTDLILAALLHDIGKKYDKRGHEHIGAKLLEPFVSPKTIWLIKNHMRIWTYILGDMKKKSKCDEIAYHPWLPELIQLARWDKKGRNPNRKVTYDPTDIIDRLNIAADKHFTIPEHL